MSLRTVAVVRRDAYERAVVYLAKAAETDDSLAQTPCPIYRLVQERGLELKNVACDANIDGFSFKQTIFVSTKLGPIRARFTVAHELAHVVYDIGPDRKTNDTSSLREMEVNAFAAGLLMPHGAVRAAFGDPVTPQPLSTWIDAEHKSSVVTRLCTHFKVSRDTVVQTLVDMGLVTDHKPWESVFTARSLFCSAMTHGRAHSRATVV